MTTLRPVASTINPRRWMRAGSVLISFAAVTLLVAAFGAKFYSRSLSSILLTLVLIALCTAIALHVRFLILARREHRETSSALDATEREFKSIFDNALDGILILDDQGICLEANPAAQTLFGTRYHELVGQPIGNFYAGGGISPKPGRASSTESTNTVRQNFPKRTAPQSSSNTPPNQITCPENMSRSYATSPAEKKLKLH